MQGDIRLQLSDSGCDIALEGGDLAIDPGLSSAVIASLWSDRRAEQTDVPPEVNQNPGPFAVDPRGWWADTARDRYGSHFWLLERAKATGATAARAEEAARAALAWLLSEEIARTLTVSAEFDAAHRLTLAIAIERHESRRWSSLWRGTEGDIELGAVKVRLLVS